MCSALIISSSAYPMDGYKDKAAGFAVGLCVATVGFGLYVLKQLKNLGSQAESIDAKINIVDNRALAIKRRVKNCNWNLQEMHRRVDSCVEQFETMQEKGLLSSDDRANFGKLLKDYDQRKALGVAGDDNATAIGVMQLELYELKKKVSKNHDVAMSRAATLEADMLQLQEIILDNDQTLAWLYDKKATPKLQYAFDKKAQKRCKSGIVKLREKLKPQSITRPSPSVDGNSFTRDDLSSL